MLEKVGLPAGLAHRLADRDVGISRRELASTSEELAKLIGNPTTLPAKTIACVVRT